MTVVVTNFDAVALPRILTAVTRSGIKECYVGTYGANVVTSQRVREAGLKYAPVFQTNRGTAWEGRKGTDQWSGPVPEHLEQTTAHAWGVEVGRRYRDRMTAPFDSWQLDELGPGLHASPVRRAFVAGIIEGLRFGRANEEVKGFIWATRTFLAQTPVEANIWDDVHLSAHGLIGEEYPAFRGSAFNRARHFADGHRRLRRTSALRHLSGRYFAGLTPGYHRAGHLGGKRPGQTRAEVERWRTKYISERKKAGVAGFGVYYLHGLNADESVLRDVFRAIA